MLQPEVSAIFTMSSAAELLDGGAALPGVSGGCLGALLIRLLVQFGVDQNDADTLADQLADATANPQRRLKWSQTRKSSLDRLLVPILSETCSS